MSVQTHDIPSYDKLKELIPSSVFVKDLTFNSRNIVKQSSDSMVGVSDNFPSTQVARFTIPQTPSMLYNVDEWYINFAAIGKFYDKNNKVVDDKITKFNDIIIPPYWWIGCINRVELFVGGVCVWDKNNLINLANFYTSHYHSWKDRQNSQLEQEGIYKMNSFKYVEKGTDLKSIEDTGVIATPLFSNSTIANTPDLTSQTKPYNFQIYNDAEHDEDTFECQQIIYLHDLIPEIKTLCCIWNQPIVLQITFSDLGHTLIQPLYPNTSTCVKAQITKFNAFNLNVVSYGLDSTMIDKMASVYSKQVLKVVDEIQYFNNSMNITKTGETLELKLSLNLKFSSDLINLSFPVCTASNFVIPFGASNWEVFDINNPEKILYNRTKLTNCFMPIKSISVYADNILLYQRNYGTSKIQASTDSDPIMQCFQKVGSPDFNDFLDCYKCYRESLYCTYQDESDAIPFSEFLFSYFSINILTANFSRISTSANVVVSIVWGTGINDGSGNGYSFEKFSTTDTTRLNTVKTIIKSKKALCFNPGNRCEVKNIEASFTNEYDMDAIQKETQTLN
jgi:hypothetical protein